jgi:sulfur carrier protein
LSYPRELKSILFRFSILTDSRMSFNMIQLIINGQTQHFESTLNVAQLLERMTLNNKRIAIEYNGQIVPRSKFKEQTLVDGDQLEIVVAVGGG